MKRFDGYFVDSVLILLWSALGCIVLLGGVFTAMPSLQTWLGAQFTNERMVMGTSVVFLWGTAYRILTNFNLSRWLLAFCYVIVQVGYAAAWTHGMMPKPINILYAPVVPGAFLSMACVPLSYVWERIKPLPSRRRKPRRVQQ